MPRPSPQPRWTGRLAHRATEDRILGRAAEAVRKAEPVTSPTRRAAIIRSALKDIRQLEKEARRQISDYDKQFALVRWERKTAAGVRVAPHDERDKRLAAIVRQATAMVEQLAVPTEA